MAVRRIPKGTRELPEYVSTYAETYARLDAEEAEREEQRLTRGPSFRSNQLVGWQGGR